MRQLAGRATSKLLPKGWKLETLQTTAAQTPCRRRPVGTACAGCTGFEERRPDLWTKFRFRYNEYPQLVATGLSLEIKFRISYQPVSMSSAASHQSRGPHLNDNEDQTDELPGVLLRRPTLQYVLLAALGILGIYLSLPLGFDPQTTVEWVDLIINIIILVPSSVLLAAGTGLAVLSGLSPRILGTESRPARLTRTILRIVGIPRAIIPQVAVLGPIGLLIQIFWEQPSEEALPDGSDPDEHA
jgi:hypothetical protein